MDEWNYDLEAVPRGCPVMVRTRHNTRRVVTVPTGSRAVDGRIFSRTVPGHAPIKAQAWRELTDEELEALPEFVGSAVRFYRSEQND